MAERVPRGWQSFPLIRTTERELRIAGKGLTRAIVPLRVFGTRFPFVPSSAVIDTGSPITLLNRENAEVAGIDIGQLPPGPPVTAKGLRDRPTRGAVVEMEIDGISPRWTAQVYFLEDDVPMRYSMLGFEGFLEMWNLLLLPKEGRFALRFAD